MPPRRSLSEADWFWDKVDRSGDCWIWNGAQVHGYGRVIIGQVPYRAHHVAWFLVMGTWPQDNLYRVGPCRDGVQGHQKGDPEHRRCVKPDHYRDGLEPNAKRRWLVSAQNGFPPEFRKAQSGFMSSARAEKDLLPVLLYRGNLTMGRAQALFNWTMVVRAEEAVRLGDVVDASRAWPDALHAVGLHKPITVTSTMSQFWGRLLDNPKVLDPHPGMKDYIETTLAQSGGRSPIRLERIDRYSPWASRKWRKPKSVCNTCLGEYQMGEVVAHRLSDLHRRAVRERKQQTYGPMPEVWPYIADKPTTDHDLILSVDGVVPKGLPEAIRQDVCQDLILAVLEGEITTEELRGSVDHYVKQVFRQYPTKYGPLSLDQPAPWQGSDDERTLGDLLVAAGWNTERNGWSDNAA